MQNQITELEKHLYNKHLITSRSIKNKPFKVKKDFADIIDTDKHKFLKRISVLFKKHPEIDPDLFFKAPYELYKDVEFFGLDYFSTMRAVKAYTTYKKQMFLQNPDCQIEQVKASLHFIVKFCIENEIYLHQYPYHRSSDLFTWMTHYKQNKINLYSLFEFSDLFSSVQTLAEDIKRLYVKDFIDQFKNLYVQYQNSKLVKPYLKKTIPILNEFVRKNLVDKHQK
jgi:hypothetical protein